MGVTSNISWCDSTWNPWHGCHKVSTGCKHCYMFSGKKRFGQDPDVIMRSKPWTFEMPLRLMGYKKVFACSWSDFFIEESDPWRDEAMDIIRRTQHLTYQILTKRPERAYEYLNEYRYRVPQGNWSYPAWPLPNVWVGVSVENQTTASERLRWLAGIIASKRFISYEPALGPVNFRPWLPYIDWVICGGESGPGYRTCNVAWLQQCADQCFNAGVPVWVKQDSGPLPGCQGRIPDALWGRKAFPLDAR